MGDEEQFSISQTITFDGTYSTVCCDAMTFVGGTASCLQTTSSGPLGDCHDNVLATATSSFEVLSLVNVEALCLRWSLFMASDHRLCKVCFETDRLKFLKLGIALLGIAPTLSQSFVIVVI